MIMKISLIIGTRYVNNVVIDCLKSMLGQHDEIILIDDRVGYEVKNLAQVLNKGLKRATGDLLVVSNDDVILTEGKLKDLYDLNNVVSPKVVGGIDKLFHAHMFAMTRKQFKDVGYFDEEYQGAYWIDSDYWMRISEAGYGPVKNEKVVIVHEHPANTLNAINENTQLGKDRFIEKWGEEALNYVR